MWTWRIAGTTTHAQTARKATARSFTIVVSSTRRSASRLRTFGSNGLPAMRSITATGITTIAITETAAANIRVNAVAPGSARTKLIDQGIKDGSIRSEWQEERIPMGRLAEPREIADPIVYLASDRASYVTGQTLVVDGGWTVQGMVHIASWLQPPASRL